MGRCSGGDGRLEGRNCINKLRCLHFTATSPIQSTTALAQKTNRPTNSSWTKARPLPRLQGAAVSAVGWQRQPRPASAGAAGGAVSRAVAALEEEADDLDNTTG